MASVAGHIREYLRDVWNCHGKTILKPKALACVAVRVAGAVADASRIDAA